MKKLITLFAALVLMSGLSTLKAQQQVTALATGSATIVTPIAITKTVDMNFGNIAVSSSTPGTVVLSPANVRTATGGITLPAATGTVSVASFNVTGVGNSAYSITLPTTDYIISNGSNSSMTINAFTSDPSGTGTLNGGSQTINVGATLNVGAGQAVGTYTGSTPFGVTVHYN